MNAEMLALGPATWSPYFTAHARDGHQALVELAIEHSAPQTEWWIKRYLSQLEAQILYIGLRQKPSFIPKLIELIPPQFTTSVVAKAETVNSFLVDSYL